MSSSFHRRIKDALADSNLQEALDANAERRANVRKSGFASLEDHGSLRHQAHAIRSEVIANLDHYLEQFCQQATANGMIVHRAIDAHQAVQTVLEITRQHKGKLVAKSKTMVSEEIHLNHALESAGLRVVETDLGEYIVQLRGEPPAHIITPAVHLRRSDVGRLFQERLGLPYTEDIPVMTAAARQVLREVFLQADIGVSGVNLAVAESGTLCVLTNEGNGRMVTTLPPVHIALLGMERLVPTLDDLALMLRLLPRSATGQKLTVYTNLLHAPRRPGDPDGPQERHVVIVDNGRSRLRESLLAEMLFCIRCGACLNACPVFREIGGHAYVGVAGQGSPYPGPMGSVLAPGLFGSAEFGHLARASSLCGACREVCPVDIDLPRLLLRVRAGMVMPCEPGIDPGTRIKPNPPGWLAFGLHFFTWAAKNPKRFRLAQKLAGTFLGGYDWLRLPAFTGWGFSKDFPGPAKQTFQERWTQRVKPPVQTNSSNSIVHSLDDAVSSGQTGIRKGDEGENQEELVRLLQKELEALGARFIRCTHEELSGRVCELLDAKGCQEILAWESAHLPAGLVESLQESGIRLFHPTSDDTQQAALIRAGLTGAIAAAVETGSLAIAGGPGRSLSTSLLPEMHIALLAAETIVARLDKLLKLPEISQSAAAVLVSGASRTADIEMTLTIGVHGPGELVVIVY